MRTFAIHIKSENERLISHLIYEIEAKNSERIVSINLFFSPMLTCLPSCRAIDRTVNFLVREKSDLSIAMNNSSKIFLLFDIFETKKKLEWEKMSSRSREKINDLRWSKSVFLLLSICIAPIKKSIISKKKVWNFYSLQGWDNNYYCEVVVCLSISSLKLSINWRSFINSL